MVSKPSLRQNLLTSVFVLFVTLLPYMACAIPFHLTLVSSQCCLLPYSLLSQIPSLVSSSLLPLVLCSCLCEPLLLISLALVTQCKLMSLQKVLARVLLNVYLTCQQHRHAS